jgi:hypothetical protein
VPGVLVERGSLCVAANKLARNVLYSPAAGSGELGQLAKN